MDSSRAALSQGYAEFYQAAKTAPPGDNLKSTYEKLLRPALSRVAASLQNSLKQTIHMVEMTYNRGTLSQGTASGTSAPSAGTAKSSRPAAKSPIDTSKIPKVIQFEPKPKKDEEEIPEGAVY